MKILTLVWSIGIGGTERAAVNYAIGYKVAGIDSRVLVLGEGADRKPDLLNAGIYVTMLSDEVTDKHAVFNNIKNWGPDVIHIHNFSAELADYIRLIKSNKTRVVQTNVFSRPDYSADATMIDASLQLTHWGLWKYQHAMNKQTYIPVSKVVPYFVLTDRFVPPSKEETANFLMRYNIPPDAFVVGRIGQPHPSKWDSRLLSIIEKTVSPLNNFYYILAGLPQSLKEQLNACSELVKQRVKIIDEIKGDVNLSVFYHSLNVFAHISRIGESFGYVLTEAMLCKVPVITWLTPLKDNGQFEVVGDEIGGFCVANENNFIAAITRLHADKALREKFSITAREWVLSRFSPEANIESLLVFYKTLINKTASKDEYNRAFIDNALKKHSFPQFLKALINIKNSSLAHKTIALIRGK